MTFGIENESEFLKMSQMRYYRGENVYGMVKLGKIKM